LSFLIIHSGKSYASQKYWLLCHWHKGNWHWPGQVAIGAENERLKAGLCELADAKEEYSVLIEQFKEQKFFLKVALFNSEYHQAIFVQLRGIR